MRFRISFEPEARQELAALGRADQKRVLSLIESLGIDPHPTSIEPMAGFRDFFRIRAGAFRIIYRIMDNQLIIQVIRVGEVLEE